MNFISRFLTVTFIILLPLKVYADNSVDNSVDTLALSQTTEWRALLHISTEKNSNQIESYVDDNTFFIATDGDENPQEELLATLNGLKINSSIQCKYPARTAFLFSKIPGLSSKAPSSDCKEYLNWRKRLNTKTIILVFASAQLNSPSSMYGHTFLRFDTAEVDNNSTYLSYALNFGATVPENENGFLYAAKGLTGGYPGNFAANPYFEKIKEYSRLENRDLWEYKLNLTDDEIDKMLSHIWELQGINFEYYFFDENCSFRLLELLDVARPGLNLTNNFPVTAMPLDTIRVVDDANLIAKKYYRPSILTELEAHLTLLSAKERKLVLALSKDIDFLLDDNFVNLPTEKQQLIVDSTYRYLRYKNTFNGRDVDITRRSFELLRYLNKNPTNLDIFIPTPTSPDKGHKTTMVSVSVGQNDKNDFAEFKYRGSYHDLIDPLDGYYAGMSLNMVNISFRVYENDDIKLDKAELLNIISLSERNEFVSPWSWKANISVEQQWTGEKELIVTQGSAGKGVSYRPLDNSYVFLMATGRLEFNRKLNSYINIAPGLHAGLIYYLPKTTFLLEVEHYQFLFDQTKRSRISFQQNIQIGNTNSIRLSAEFHKVVSKVYDVKKYAELKIEYRYFF